MDTYFAFFDLDGTLINTKSMFSFLKYYLKRKHRIPAIGSAKYGYFVAYTFYLKHLFRSRTLINQKYYENFDGIGITELQDYGRAWWAELAETKGIFIKPALAELKYHQQQGAKIILVSGSMMACVEPIAKLLGVDHCILSVLEEREGLATGKLINGSTIGEGKKQKILAYLAKHGHHEILPKSFAYGDHISDLPMLQLVGNPRVVGNDKKLVSYAHQQGWKIIRSENE